LPAPRRHVPPVLPPAPPTPCAIAARAGRPYRRSPRPDRRAAYALRRLRAVPVRLGHRSRAPACAPVPPGPPVARCKRRCRTGRRSCRHRGAARAAGRAVAAHP
jgi:hypothetical protein